MRVLRDLVGETLSERYRVVARIAGGGMGEVYRGHDLLLDRTVAIKVLMPSLAVDPDLVARFRAEARAAARLNHPNVVAVHDWGSQDDRTYYMVMEYVAGTDLRDVLVGRGPLDPAHAADVVAAVCDALDAAHRTGLVHRDVKPENVLIARDGTIKVADFGIAAVADAERTAPGGGILGTLRYLSPEQAAGGDATAASDIWSAGALLYELLIGTPPQGGSGAELLHRRASEEITPPSRLEPGLPGSLDEIVLTACALRPQDRFLDAGEMAAALRRTAAGMEPVERPVTDLFVDVTDEIRLPQNTPSDPFAPGGARRYRRHRLRRRVFKFAAVVVALGLLGFGGWQGAAAVLGPKEVEVPDLTELTESRARSTAEEAGFEISVDKERRHETVAIGQVISQDPASGMLLQGETISLLISKGPPLVKLPDLTGRKLNQAAKWLLDHELVLGEKTEEFSTKHPVGVVIEQGAAKGQRLERGSAVDLVVSKGPRMIEMPNVVGKTKDAATETLEAAGFKVVSVEVYSDDVAPGKVVSTTPAPGADAPEAGEVQIAVSIGPEFKEFKMPDVRGMSVDAAKEKLKGMGLVVKVRESCPGSTVQETSPIAGTKVRENDEVTLFLC
ncbi:MAG: Stk1 family PASTA domain-containing Ser/Thr kinase [Actinomycetota bacterium]